MLRRHGLQNPDCHHTHALRDRGARVEDAGGARRGWRGRGGGGTIHVMNIDTAAPDTPLNLLPANLGAVVKVRRTWEKEGTVYIRVKPADIAYAWYSRDTGADDVCLERDAAIVEVEVLADGWQEPLPEPPPWSMVQAWDDGEHLVLAYDGELDGDAHWRNINDTYRHTWAQVSKMCGVQVLGKGLQESA